MTLNELLVEWSYRTEKGYPDMGNPSDILILKEILERLELPTDILDEDEPKVNISTDEPQEEPTPEPDQTSLAPEGKGSLVYDEVIKKTLGVDEIPRSKNKYQFKGKGGSSFSLDVQPDDMDIWLKLWNTAPPKKGETEGATKGVGNGEISLYWLYHYSNSGIKVDEGRSGDDPDLFFNGIGVEVKAYKSHSGKKGLGRYGADKDNLALLSIIFGLNSLAAVIGGGEGAKKVRTINPTNFNGTYFIPALENVIKFGNIDQLEDLAADYPVFRMIRDNVNSVVAELDNPQNGEEAARRMAVRFLTSKLGRKPRDGGYLASVLKTGNCLFYGIDLNKMANDPNLLSNMGSSQSSMVINFIKTFPPS